jgi:GPH family glycoside/pentoside/hexuronide:cation symporter/probable glucitol transport protein GutA
MQTYSDASANTVQNACGSQEVRHEIVSLKEKLSYAFTNTGQCFVYGLFGMLLLYMTDYLGISPAIAGMIISLTRIFDAINDPIMGQIVDKTNTKWGKCRPYMLFTPVPIALIAMLLFAPWGLTGGAAIAYISVIYTLFTIAYTANDIPYWSMSAVITTDPKQRTTIVTLTRLIGGLGSAAVIGGFWLINKLFINLLGASRNMGFFLSVTVFCILGILLMLQGFFQTKERATGSAGQKNLLSNLVYIFKAKPLLLNLIGGALFSVITVGTVALTTYFVKWNIGAMYPDMKNADVMALYSPLMGILPGAASVIGLLIAPFLIRKIDKKWLLIVSSLFGAGINVAAFFVGYQNLILFSVLRFFAFLPLGLWSSVTTLMIGDSVDYIEYHTGKRIEGTCFSLLTFMGKFQNSINVALTGLILSFVNYDGQLDPDIVQQTPKTLQGIFIMVTLVMGLGYILAMIPFFFYKLDNATCKMMAEENLKKRLAQQ